LIAEYAREEGKGFAGMTPEAQSAFRAYSWPGNVREVQNVLRNIAVLRDGPEATLAMLPPKIARCASSAVAAEQPKQERGGPQAADGQAVDPHGALSSLIGLTLSEVEREFIEATIASCGGSIPRAARILDVSPSTLYRKRESWDRTPQ
jgi:DNA-binding NtrC family response regulator